VRILQWKQIAGPAAFHAARASYTRSKSFPRHGHDFAELFWIDAGRGEHWINGHTLALTTGSLVLMRPTDFHGIQSIENQELRLTNIAFPGKVLELFRERYFPAREWAFWPGDKLPAMVQIEPAQLRRFNRWADELSGAPKESLHLDRFLLNLLAELSLGQADPLPDDAPDWLAHACRAIESRENFSQGVERFLRLCGRSREHVARSVRRHLKTTPTDYVNRIRIAYARRQIEMGDQGILELALDCGINNLSHFYHLFRVGTGMTPRVYRLSHRKPL
jgi:AraC family cel operon transcriptional repressor